MQEIFTRFLDRIAYASCICIEAQLCNWVNMADADVSCCGDPAALRDAGIVEATRRGKEVYHRVRYRALAATLRAGADAIEACCPSGG